MPSTPLIILLIATLVMFAVSYALTMLITDILLANSRLSTRIDAARISLVIATSFLLMGYVANLGWQVFMMALILIIIAGIGLLTIPRRKKRTLYIISVLVGLSGSLVYAVALYLSDFYQR